MSHPKTGARAVADLDTGTILASVEIAAPVERVFRALTSGADITEWWGSSDTYRTTRWTGDVRPGGHWKAEGVGADGHEFSVEGEFLEVAPHRIVQTWKAPWDGNHETRITYKLDPIDGGTRITLRHEGFAGRAESCTGHSDGWTRVFGWLGKYLEPAANDHPFFLARLIPPRTSFPADITPEEADLMRAHSAHCKTLLDQGQALVFGPIADPAGAWGLAILRAPSADAARALTDADPVVKAGRGFRYEILPMMSAIH